MSVWQGKAGALVRREFWEHRALVLAPLVAAGLILVAVIFGDGPRGTNGQGFSMGVSPEMLRQEMRSANLATAGQMTLIATSAFLGVVAGVVALLYLLDCLYAERKDRSILFWKSLPVSDVESVAAKLAVALLVVPVLVMTLALVMQPLMAGIMLLRHEMLREVMEPATFGRWISGWPPALGRMLATWVFSVLWYLPVVAYLMLASVLSRRAPLGMALLPPVLLVLLWEVLLDLDHVSNFLNGQLFPWIWAAPSLLTIGGDWTEPLLQPRLWIGVAAGIAMLCIVVRLRRYRDDT